MNVSARAAEQLRRAAERARLLLLASGANVLAHVRVHVGDEEIGPAVVVVVEELDPHRAPGRPREVLRGLVDERLAAGVLEIVVVPLHVEDVEIGPAVAVQVGDAGVAAPARRPQPDVRGDVLEPVVAHVLVEDADTRCGPDA